MYPVGDIGSTLPGGSIPQPLDSRRFAAATDRLEFVDWQAEFLFDTGTGERKSLLLLASNRSSMPLIADIL
jgi:hypothetical protein